nr:unnamed protein product [Callosobruchus chinensis]
MRCFKCQRFGHTSNLCTAEQLCVCGKRLHEDVRKSYNSKCLNGLLQPGYRLNYSTVYHSNLERQKVNYYTIRRTAKLNLEKQAEKMKTMSAGKYPNVKVEQNGVGSREDKDKLLLT